ncbi:MAG: response regulator [Magnetococcales bacterium]|nr:response regulator [Magnetococcales bacterium]
MDTLDPTPEKKRMTFRSKSAARSEAAKPSGTPWKILVVDDDPQIHILTEEILKEFTFESRSLLLISGYSGHEAQELLGKHPDAAVILLDVVMETSHAGLDVVKFIRDKVGNQNLRILLRTGQAGQFPEEKIFEEYDINNFLEKTDLTSRRLKTALKVGLRAYRDISELDLARQRESELRLAADAASKAKTNFLHMMSHELRTPLQGTKGPFEEFKGQFHLFSGVKRLRSMIHSLNDDQMRTQFASALQETYDEVVDIASQGLKSVEHLLGLIEDVLDFARIEAGKLTLSIAPLAIQEPIQDVITTLRPLAEKKGLQLDAPLNETITVIADGKRFKQILFNLLGNAIKFTNSGSVTLTVSHHGKQALFLIEDTGCGIPPEKLSVIFEAFEQVDNSSTRHAGGTGLGLPITRELVSRQGGEIHVESTPGQGSRFSFSLPLA